MNLSIRFAFGRLSLRTRMITKGFISNEQQQWLQYHGNRSTMETTVGVSSSRPENSQVVGEETFSTEARQEINDSPSHAGDAGAHTTHLKIVSIVTRYAATAIDVGTLRGRAPHK